MKGGPHYEGLELLGELETEVDLLQMTYRSLCQVPRKAYEGKIPIQWMMGYTYFSCPIEMASFDTSRKDQVGKLSIKLM